MANLDRIVNVQIALNTTGISREGFSTGLIIGEHAHTLGRVQIYTSLEELISDGFTSTDPLYLAANDYFAQTPKPKELKIGRRKCTTEITVGEILETGTYSILVLTKDTDGNVATTPYTFVNSGATDPDVILGAVQAIISSDTDAVINTVLDSSGILKISPKSGEDFAIKVSDNLTMNAGTSTEDLATTMAKITAEDNDWYGLMMTSREQADILALAAWTEAHRKIFGTAISDAGAKDRIVTTDTGYLLQSNNYYRTFWFYHENAETDFPECAVMAKCFSILPGGETWANKKLAGVTPNQITETEAQAIFYKNGNTFEKFRNISITQSGKTAAGEWIDVIRFRDWLQEEIQTRVFDAMVNNNKIPYTDGGIAIIETQIRGALELGQRRGGIAPTEYDENGDKNLGFTVEVPLASTISAGQKASRVLTDVKFTARLAGAIHVVEIFGSLTYENLIERGAA